MVPWKALVRRDIGVRQFKAVFAPDAPQHLFSIMVLVLLIGFSICFASGFLLSVVLLLKDFFWLRGNMHSRVWEGAVALLFSTFQLGISIAGMVAVTIAFATDTEPLWLDPIILCTLQLFAGMNVSVTPSRNGVRIHPYGSSPGHFEVSKIPARLFG